MWNFQTKAILAVVLIIAVSATGLWVKNMMETIAVQKAAIVQFQADVDTLRDDLHSANERYNALIVKFNAIETESRQFTAELASYRGRLNNVAKERPDSATRILNAGWRQRMRELAVLTGADPERLWDNSGAPITSPAT